MWSSRMLSPSLGSNPASPPGQPAALPAARRGAQPHFPSLPVPPGKAGAAQQHRHHAANLPAPSSLEVGVRGESRILHAWGHVCGRVTAGILSPAGRMQVSISQWTPLSLARSSTHLPILKLLQAVDTLKGPRLDSLRLLDQLCSQDWGEEGGKGALTFNQLKVGRFCWWEPWLSEQTEPRLLPHIPPQPSHCWKKIPSTKRKCLQCFGMYQPIAVSGRDACCRPWLEGFDPSSLNQQPPA